MARSIFEHTADGLEDRTDLQKLEARGTVRLALKQAGLDADSVTADQMLVVLDQVLPVELAARGVDQPERVCVDIAVSLKAAYPVDSQGSGEDDESPEAVFRRLARG